MGGLAAVNFLGPEGIDRRVSEIQSRLDAFFPREAAPSAVSFKGHLDACGGTAPMDPFDVGGLRGPIGGPSDLRGLAERAAARHGVDKALFSQLVEAESGWNPSAVSRVGAKGLCQLMDPTARELGVGDSFDPGQSLDGGARYLRQMLDRFGDPATALAAYNAGPGFVARHSPAQWSPETKGYVRRILSGWGGGV